MYNYTSTRDSSWLSGLMPVAWLKKSLFVYRTHAAFLGLKRYFGNLSSFTTITLIRPLKNHR